MRSDAKATAADTVMPGVMPWLRAGPLQERTGGRLPPVVMISGAGCGAAGSDALSAGIARAMSCKEKSAKWRQDQSIEERKGVKRWKVKGEEWIEVKLTPNS